MEVQKTGTNTQWICSEALKKFAFSKIIIIFFIGMLPREAKWSHTSASLKGITQKMPFSRFSSVKMQHSSKKFQNYPKIIATPPCDMETIYEV